MINFIATLKREESNIENSLLELVNDIPVSLRDVVSYSLFAGGKRLRPFFTVLTAKLFGVSDNGIYTLAALPEFIHTASLLHDDLIDNAELRRGKTATHIKFGSTLSILAGDAMLALVNQRAAQYQSPSIIEEISEAVLMTAVGEAEEISLQHHYSYGFDKYLDIIKGKTAYLIKCSCSLGALYANASIEHKQAISNYGLNLGLAFQIIDDALDFSDKIITGKPEGGDLLEGKFTPPIMLYSETLSEAEKKQFFKKFSNSSFTIDEVHIISCTVRELGILEKSKNFAEQFLIKAENSLLSLPFSHDDLKLFFESIDFVRNRVN